jgi:hypothetical protein
LSFIQKNKTTNFSVDQIEKIMKISLVKNTLNKGAGVPLLAFLDSGTRMQKVSSRTDKTQ